MSDGIIEFSEMQLEDHNEEVRKAERARILEALRKKALVMPGTIGEPILSVTLSDIERELTENKK